MFARIHNPTNTVVCLASNRANLHNSWGDHLGLTDDYANIEVELGGRVGDLFKGGRWTPKAENYPQPSPEEERERKISAEMRRLAEESLRARGEL